MKNRIEWVDTAKGLGIALVVIAHVFIEGGAFRSAALLIYSFHMPMFFILSGYVLSERTIAMPLSKIFAKYIISLLIPYFVYTSLNMITQTILERDFTTITLIENTKNLILLRGWKATWFLSALFVSILELIILMKAFKNPVSILIATCILSIGLIYVRCHIPFDEYIKVMLLGTMALPFVTFGYVIKCTKIKNYIFNKVSLVIFLLFIPILAFYNGKVDFLAYNFGKSPVVWMISGIIGSAVMIEVCKHIHIEYIKTLGQNSLTIMCIHQVIMICSSRLISHFITNRFIITSLLMIITFIITGLAYPIVSKIYKKIIRV